MPTEEQQAAAPASSDADAAAPVAAAVAAAASSSSSPPPSSDAAAAAPESKKRKVDVAVPSSPPAHTDPEAEEEDESDNELHDLLGCQQCKFPLVHAEDIMMTSAAEISSSVYRYNLELDLCNEEIPCYSSDNPHGVRFDVVRTKAHSYVAASPPEESSHSFFPGFAWTNISCGRCSKHLGWGFSKNVDPAASAAVAAVLAVAAGASVASVGTVGEVAVATEFDYTQIDFNPTMMFTDVMRMIRELQGTAGSRGMQLPMGAVQINEENGEYEIDLDAAAPGANGIQIYDPLTDEVAAGSQDSLSSSASDNEHGG